MASSACTISSMIRSKFHLNPTIMLNRAKKSYNDRKKNPLKLAPTTLPPHGHDQNHAAKNQPHSHLPHHKPRNTKGQAGAITEPVGSKSAGEEAAAKKTSAEGGAGRCKDDRLRSTPPSPGRPRCGFGRRGAPRARIGTDGEWGGEKELLSGLPLPPRIRSRSPRPRLPSRGLPTVLRRRCGRIGSRGDIPRGDRTATSEQRLRARDRGLTCRPTTAERNAGVGLEARLKWADRSFLFPPRRRQAQSFVTRDFDLAPALTFDRR
ncbi:hypothetical protein BS78_10G078900 [Paspalum vaginatum]|nr:hypothetical protein BS78_10G078900 [Paspalum vaginatum]